ENRKNALLIRDSLNNRVQNPNEDPEIKDASRKLLTRLHMLGAFTLTVDDSHEALGATSDFEDTSIHIFDDPDKGEVVAFKDPFFDSFIADDIPTVFFLEAVGGQVDPNHSPRSDGIQVYA